MRTEADENYLKEIYNLSLDNQQVTTSMLAERLRYTPATVSGMLKKLAGLSWVDYEPYQGVRLTESGRAVALEVIRHHRLIETYLAKALNIPWEKVHDEAEVLEHSLSEYLEERIDEQLGRPKTDPHGSPIPSHGGEISASARLRLVDLSPGDRGAIVEVNDRIPGLLTQLDKRKLFPGTEFKVLNVEPIDALITIQSSGKQHILGRTTAGQIIVRKIGAA
jgi:DtxR family Mn-dependent transcriptional regulator